MTLTIFEYSMNAEPVEIAIASRLLYKRSADGSAAPLPDLRGGYDQWAVLTEPGLQVYLDGLKTPVSPAPGAGGLVIPGNIFQRAQDTSQEVKNLELIIATLVHMMGGAVTIHDHEVEHHRRGTLGIMHYQDPRKIVLKVED